MLRGKMKNGDLFYSWLIIEFYPSGLLWWEVVLSRLDKTTILWWAGSLGLESA